MTTPAKNPVDELAPYLPAGALPFVARWFETWQFSIQLSSDRRTKLGDFRPGQNGQIPRISVNRTLNPYAFLITLIHEVAHLKTWKEYQGKVKPHSREWKENFRLLGQPFIQAGIFPVDVEKAFSRVLAHPGARSTSDEKLRKVLNTYNPFPEIFLEELEEGAIFQIGNGRFYKKGEKRQKRFVCESLANGRKYLFHPLTTVQPVH